MVVVNDVKILNFYGRIGHLFEQNVGLAVVQNLRFAYIHSLTEFTPETIQ